MDNPWQLGDLAEGWEWLAFTFADQPKIGLTPTEVQGMLEAADQVTRQAYSRMQVKRHAWAKSTEKECREIVEYCNLREGCSVLDLGCGHGRYALGLARSGLSVTGVDYIAEFIDDAKTSGRKVPGARFVEADCREVRFETRFDAVVCLYDVVGTYATLEDNSRILETIAVHLKPGGYALISVMNLTVTKRQAKHVFSLRCDPDRLLALPASRTMETTGNVFNPDYYMLDEESNVVYRKEQFTEGHDQLPVEFIVRDRRFTTSDIEGMCNDAGLGVVWARLVRAGGWHEELRADDDRAKEILVLCQRPG